MSKENDGSVYLITPDDGGDQAETALDPSNEEQSLQKVMGVFGGRKEIKAKPEAVQSQINNYVSIVQNLAKSEEAKSGSLKLSEIKLSLTVSGSGNIGIASTSAEAGLELVFKRT